MTFFLKKYADQIGIAASGLCLVHCLLMPFILAFWLGHNRCAESATCREESTGFNYDYLFLGFSALAVWLASGHCSRRWLKTLMWGSFIVLAGGILADPWMAGAHYATQFAAITLAISHFINWRYCRQCNRS